MTEQVSPTHSGAVAGVAWATSRGSGAWPGAEHRSPAGRQDAGLGTGFSGARILRGQGQRRMEVPGALSCPGRISKSCSLKVGLAFKERRLKAAFAQQTLWES